MCCTQAKKAYCNYDTNMIKIILRLVIPGIVILYSCQTQPSDNWIKHERLLTFKSKFISDVNDVTDDLYFNNPESFFQNNYTETYLNDTLIVSYLIDINACSQFIGNIEILNDTIKLITKDIAEEQCASASIERFTFMITNPENKKYTIVK